MTITGANFTGTTQVTFGPSGGGGRSANFVVDSAVSIRTVVPAGLSSGLLEVQVTTPDGMATSSFYRLPTCMESFDPPSTAFTALGGSFSVSFSAPPTCAWSADGDWTISASPRGGQGSGSVTFDVRPNAGAERSWSLFVGNRPLPVSQAGSYDDLRAGLIGVRDAAVAWGDYDNDGDLDIVLTGARELSGNAISKVYRNDGHGSFTDIGAGLPPIYHGAVAWGDYDNDGDLDLLLAGRDSDTESGVTKLYRNDGGVFADIAVSLPGADVAACRWGDYDNDGDLDILLSGYVNYVPLSAVYRNDGGGTFTDIGANLTGVGHGDVAWGDYDRDGDLDIVLSGAGVGSGVPLFTKIYRNDGGVFTDIAAGLVGLMWSSVAWGDYDNDGDLDILLGGYSTLLAGVTKVYRNDGGGMFKDVGPVFTGNPRGSVAWVDYDNDGDLDILSKGVLYRNDGGVGANFTRTDVDLSDGYGTVFDIGDYDRDGDADIVRAGTNGGLIAQVYRAGSAHGAFFSLNPCRVLDTRGAANSLSLGGPPLAAGTERQVRMLGLCGVPATAQAVSVNLTVTAPTTAGNLRLYPAGAQLPETSTINYAAGQTRANSAVVALSATGDLAIRSTQQSGVVQLVLDVNGYFE